MYGLSCVICCHNSAERLPQTLKHLAAQNVQEGLKWEVIIIDNASTDETEKTAVFTWNSTGKPAPLRVVYEQRLGIGHARYRGIAEAKYNFVSFIDDDNWVSPTWVKMSLEFIQNHPDVGACGGLNKAVSNISLPWWFEKFQRSYAVGPQSEEPGDITRYPGVLWSAGMIIRKRAMLELINDGFSPLVIGAIGEKILMRSEDYEMCMALRLRGWKLWYEPRLQLKHYIPAERLNWQYLRRLLRGVGMSSLGLDPYYFALQNKKMKKFKQRFFIRTWQIQVLISLITLSRYFRKLILSMTYPLEGDADTLLIERSIGRLLALLKQRKKYDIMLKKIQIAPWIKVK